MTGTAVGNGNASGHYIGAAPKADIILVANALDHPNWGATVVDAVQFIVDHATALGRPVAINLSLGSYYGSHDGLDPAALMVDHLLTDQPGRVLVCAAGNSGALAPYHLRTQVTADDTTFTWFRYRPNSILGVSAVYFDVWAEVDDFDDVAYSIGADRRNGAYVHRGDIPFRTIHGTLGMVVTDTLKSFDGNRLAVVRTYAEQRGGQYHLEVFLPMPDSADAYFYRFSTTGAGRFDAWSSSSLGTSEIISDITSAAEFPPIVDYVLPDKNSSLVDSWACSPQVITVGNYYNEQVYTDINGNQQDLGGTEGVISVNSSRGPTRTGLVKPDVAAPGDIVFTAAPANMVQALINSGQAYKVAPDGQHVRSGGTSIAAPSVTGTAALFLEKCPQATNVLVRDAINAAAFADVYTGLLPNVQYGNGKLDAFAALVSSNVPVPITGPVTVCEGDSVLLEGPGPMSRYHWNTGASSRSVYSHGGDAFLQVENAAGCLGASDTIHVTALPAPPAPTVTLDGNILESTPATTYQWYLEGAPLAGADQRTHEALVSGSYSVRITDTDDCGAMSMPMSVIVTGIAEAGVARGVRAWPVPAGDQLTIALPDGADRPVSVEVFSPTGARVPCAWTWSASRIELATRGLAAGSYGVRMLGAAGAEVLRFVKE
ncbi:MAG: S8 family serine peptidase [Flavobacteriales bacterium]